MGSATLIEQARRSIRDGRLAEARRLLRQALSENPHNHAAWLLLARATPNEQAALEYVERAHQLQQDSPLVRNTRLKLAVLREEGLSERPFRWRTACIAITVFLFTGLLTMAFSRNEWSRVIAMPLDSISTAAIPSDSSVQEQDLHLPPAAEGEFSAANMGVGDDSEVADDGQLLVMTPTAVPELEQDESSTTYNSSANADTSENAVSQPVIVSNSNHALPAAILSGIEAEEGPQHSVSSAEAESQREETIPDNSADAAPENDMVIKEAGRQAEGVPEAAGVIEQEPGNFQVASGAYGSLLPKEVAPGERWIDVNLTTQTLVAYEGERPVFSSLISSGMWQFPTVMGQYRTYIKYPSQNMSGYHLGYNYYLPGVPYVMYFFEDYAIHGTYWHNNFGTPMSHGCVNMSTADAGWLYNWAPLGTVVNIHS
jgi:lipoprotein-anchoring transpeptidase ErfK/SrfK